MKFTILPILFLLSAVSLWGQKHAFGVKVGVQFPSFSSTTQGTTEENISSIGFVPQRPAGGLFYRHQLTKKLFLEISPYIYQEKYQLRYNSFESNDELTSTMVIDAVMLYTPVTLRVDLGKKLFFNIGAGSNLFLLKIRRNIDSNNRVPLKRERDVLEEGYDNLNSWPLNAEVGISYGFGRFSLNGKFVYRISDIFDSVTLSGKNYSIDLRTDYLQFEVSYRLGKTKKNK